jgi:hypothetical protein
MFEAYSVAIRLKLLDSVSSGLVGLAGQFSAFNRHVNGSQASLTLLEGQLKRVKMMAVIGGAAMGAGLFGLSLFRGPLEAAREYELAFTKFKTLNLGAAVNKQADQFARGADIMGVSATQLMQTMSESVGLFGGFAEAQKFVPKIAALNAANSAIFHGKIGQIDEGGTRSLMKFIDRRGGTKDEASFDRNLNLAEKMVTGSGGFLKFQDLAAFSQQGGTAFRSLSDTGLTNLALLLQEQGGSRAGTALMSLYQNLVAGRTPKKTMSLLADYGLGQVRMGDTGMVGRQKTRGMVMTSVKDSGLLQADPTTWFRTVFLPALAAHGVTSEAGVLKATNDLISNRTASNQASIMTTQLLQIARDASLTKNAMGADQVQTAFKNDPNAKWADLMAKYKNLMIELGETVLPIATRAVEGLTTAIKWGISFAREFPAVTKGLVIAFGVLSGLMVAGGAITLATAGFRGLGLALALGKGAGVGSMLLEVAGGLGTVSKVLGTVGVAIGTFAAAYAGTRWLADSGVSKGLGALGFTSAAKKWDSWTLGGSLYDLFHGSYDPNAKAPTQTSRFVAGGKGGGVTVHTRIDMDGRKVADAVTTRQARAVSAPLGGANFDGSLSLAPVVLNQAH